MADPRWSSGSTAARGTDLSPRTVRSLTAVLLLATVCFGLAGCGGSAKATQSGSTEPPGASKVSATQARHQEQRILDQRVRAIRERNLDLFLRRVDHSDAVLMARQRQYFTNVVQLPLAEFDYRVLDRPWTGIALSRRWGHDVRVPQVHLTTQLAGFDAVPVVRTVGFVFSFLQGRAMIVSDRTGTGKPLFAGTPAPWDLTAITVRRDGNVLGIFDAGMRGAAATVTGVVRSGIDEIDRALPFSWSRHVVVYSVRSPGVLASFTQVPGGSLDHLGALTFPTYAVTGRPQVASTRMLLLPTSVRAGQPFLGRTIRHELTHAAVGIRDDGAPAWVSEGVAEYLGARDVPQHDRIIPTSALARARIEDSGMPASATFNDSDQEWHYALSWMAFDYLAATFGETRFWELIEAMHNGGGGTSDADQDRVLMQVLGFDSRELARRAAARIRMLYG